MPQGMMRWIAYWVLAGALAAVNLPASASPILLATINGSGGFSDRGPLSPELETAQSAGVVFSLMYGWVDDSGVVQGGFYGGNSFLGAQATYAIGDPTHAFFSGQTGSLDFDPANSPDFTALMDVLADGQPKWRSQGLFLLLSDGTLNGQPFFGSVESGQEEFGGTLAALDGAQVDFVRLIVDSVFEKLETNGPSRPLAVDVSANARWQFWGECAENAQCPASVNEIVGVPEPTTLGLIGLGLLCLGAMRRRRRYD
jgi:hypothetical protein